ncbi:hypothetical protein Taro_002940, partial [Colocasia esculenta]|nr:hypothetical protein [Colocasia esculenta]
MITLSDFYRIVVAVVPLYVAMIIATISLRWWKIFTREQCLGINKFVANISIPLLSFHVISSNNPYEMNAKLILSDALQKMGALLLFGALSRISPRCDLDWIVTWFSVTTLPNTLVVGIPLLRAMYGDEAVKYLGQIIALQSIIWYDILLFLFECRAAQAAVAAPLPAETTGGTDAQEVQFKHSEEEPGATPQRKVKVRLVLLKVWQKLIRNPNTYSSCAGVMWALISFRWRIQLPVILVKSITILSDGGLGMAMFSLGLFMASQTKVIACGLRTALLAMTARFLIGPGLMAVSSFATGMRGKFLRIAIVQAALPQGIVPFVFAKEYDTHPEILSTGVTMGMLIAMPVALAYYCLLAL